MPRRKTLTLSVFLALLMAGCSKKASEEGQKKPKVFEPGKLAVYQDKDLGFSILKPTNVQAVKKGDTVRLEAAGFPTITVQALDTKEVRTGDFLQTGTTIKRILWFPKRKLVCSCDTPGDFHDLVVKICKSLKNTKTVPRQPKAQVKKTKIEGEVANLDEFKKQVDGLLAATEACWKQYLAKRPKAVITSGSASLFLIVDEKGNRQTSKTVWVDGKKGDDEDLYQCFEKATEKLAPKPKKGSVKLSWLATLKAY